MQITANKAYLPLFNNKDRYLIIKGSAGSGKSVFASQKIVARTITESNHTFLVVRKVHRTIKRSVWSELIKRIKELDLLHEFEFNKTDFTIYHKLTGNSILCVGLDDPEKLKSISEPTGVWVEESTELNKDDFLQLDTRIRGQVTNYIQIIFSFNPVDASHWIKKYFFDAEWPQTVDIDGRKITITCTTLETTFRDNRFLTDEDVAALKIKSSLSKNHYRVYYLGEWGSPDIENRFMYSFTEEHIKEVELDESLTVYVSFDFNVNPITASVHQFTRNFYHTIDEFRISNANTEELCKHIKTKYGHLPMRVTGDASGQSRKTVSRYNDYDIIKQQLRPLKIDLPRMNPRIEASRTLSNAVFAHYPNRFIHPRCVHLIEDLRLVGIRNGGIDKTTNARLTHLLDTQRYMDYTYNGDFVKKRLPQLLAKID